VKPITTLQGNITAKNSELLSPSPRMELRDELLHENDKYFIELMML